MKILKTVGAGALLVAMTSSSAFAVDDDISFTGLILDSCTIVVATDGVLAANAETSQLSSKNAGGIPGTATIVTNSDASVVEVIAPVAWTQKPLNAGNDTTFTTSYSIPVGLVTSGEVDGTVQTGLGFGPSELVINATADKGAGAYSGGQYELVATLRCVAQ